MRPPLASWLCNSCQRAAAQMRNSEYNCIAMLDWHARRLQLLDWTRRTPQVATRFEVAIPATESSRDATSRAVSSFPLIGDPSSRRDEFSPERKVFLVCVTEPSLIRAEGR